MLGAVVSVAASQVDTPCPLLEGYAEVNDQLAVSNDPRVVFTSVLRCAASQACARRRFRPLTGMVQQRHASKLTAQFELLETRIYDVWRRGMLEPQGKWEDARKYCANVTSEPVLADVYNAKACAQRLLMVLGEDGFRAAIRDHPACADPSVQPDLARAAEQFGRIVARCLHRAGLENWKDHVMKAAVSSVAEGCAAKRAGGL